jgi:hypothetical protein
MPDRRSLDRLTAAEFRPWIGSRFQLGADALAAELVEVNERQASSSRVPFSIVVRGPGAPVLPQGIHRLAHDQLGVLELFLVPLGPDDAGMRYEAVFN